MPRPTISPAWQILAKLAAERDISSRSLSTLQVGACGIHADFSRQHLPPAVLDTLLALAAEQNVAAERAAQFSGAPINRTENQSVLHTALRSKKPLTVDGVDVQAEVAHQLTRMQKFVEGVRSGHVRSITEQAFTDVVAVGIGGSSLGPRLACEALARFADGPRMHFVSNVDGAQLEDTLVGLNPATTLFLITSKTFTTDETMTNARTARAWLEAALGRTPDNRAFALHFVAITAKPAVAAQLGYTADRIFEFWPWVGGRFSLWSSVGLAVALAVGYERFASMLAGANAMDEHFCEAPLASNLPVLLALAGIWNRNFLGIGSHALLPYAHRLRNFAKYAQQLEMESNGKSVDREGMRIDYATCPVVFGDAGTDGQHSFHQLLHQGSDLISSDIIFVARDESALREHHDKLLANGFAQADALWFGRTLELAGEAYRVHVGGRPVTLLLLPELNAFYLGALIALYEHKVFVQGVIWNIHSFDQWGVELGKKIATSLLPLFADGMPATGGNSHLSEMTSRIARLRGEESNRNKSRA
ncbi:MAG: glucose-6-phosphate isomerase [Usitatibacteraceae bacterium]